jgi:transcriptional regulator with XRE-family HTH domain
MQPLHARQIKAARAILGWAQDDMAAVTGLSPTTIRNLEAGTISPRHETYHIIRQAVEEHGLEFTDREGIRSRSRDLSLFEGPDAAERFFEDLRLTIMQRGGEIWAICPTLDVLAQFVGVHERNLQRLEELSAAATVKCLLSECLEPFVAVGSIQFRAVSKLHACPTPHIVYGDKLGFASREGSTEIRFIAIQSVSIAHHWGDRFLELWNSATPFLTLMNPPLGQQQKMPERTTLSASEAPIAENTSKTDEKQQK